MQESGRGASNNNNNYGGNRLISRAGTLKGNVSNISGFNKRSTMSKDCGDISTQRRHSNEASRFNVDEEEESNVQSHRGDATALATSSNHHNAMYQYHSGAFKDH